MAAACAACGRHHRPRSSTRAPRGGTGTRSGGGSGSESARGAEAAGCLPPASHVAGPPPPWVRVSLRTNTREVGSRRCALLAPQPSCPRFPGCRSWRQGRPPLIGTGCVPRDARGRAGDCFPNGSRSRGERAVLSATPNRTGRGVGVQRRSRPSAHGGLHSLPTPLSLPWPDLQFIAPKAFPLRKEWLTQCDCVYLKAWLRQQTSTKFCSYKTRVSNAAPFPALLGSPRGTGSSVCGKARPGPLGRPLVPPPTLVPPRALSLALPGRAQRGAWLTYFCAAALLRNRAAACRWEAGGKRRSLPLEILAYFIRRVSCTANRQRFSCPQEESLQ